MFLICVMVGVCVFREFVFGGSVDLFVVRGVFFGLLVCVGGWGFGSGFVVGLVCG